MAVLGGVGNNVILAGLRYISPSAAQVLIQLTPMMLLAGAVLLLLLFTPSQIARPDSFQPLVLAIAEPRSSSDTAASARRWPTGKPRG